MHLNSFVVGGYVVVLVIKMKDISKTRNGINAQEIDALCHMTANVCVLTVCSTHTVPYKLQKSSMGSQESCL